MWLLRRGLHAAAPLVLVAGLFVALAGGLADVTVLTRSQLPTTLPYGVARAIVAVALGLGAGLTIVGALRLRPEPPLVGAASRRLVRRRPSRPLDAGPPARRRLTRSGTVAGDAVVTLELERGVPDPEAIREEHPQLVAVRLRLVERRLTRQHDVRGQGGRLRAE